MAAIPQSLPAANDPADRDPVETREWLEAFDALVETEGRDMAAVATEIAGSAGAEEKQTQPAQDEPKPRMDIYGFAMQEKALPGSKELPSRKNPA